MFGFFLLLSSLLFFCSIEKLAGRLFVFASAPWSTTASKFEPIPAEAPSLIVVVVFVVIAAGSSCRPLCRKPRATDTQSLAVDICDTCSAGFDLIVFHKTCGRQLHLRSRLLRSTPGACYPPARVPPCQLIVMNSSSTIIQSLHKDG
ncbi:uncharacterized protein LY79DRAFT_581795 [Colletotrichum navitas]|uniref:Secreted protein n=1 Tax=Colletotrichum navitas TaxID=681940 RepID=A0AAD8PU07_9PEZI|nr:uncharacterized protein LY79DRAFT_581795 [Colletotrichum navitas]KAK1580556.1 hypothetical protein LY79DRAFT_581795 [Colletotrichum navitas]